MFTVPGARLEHVAAVPDTFPVDAKALGLCGGREVRRKDRKRLGPDGIVEQDKEPQGE